jgi:RNA polymerase primary sigma factor
MYRQQEKRQDALHAGRNFNPTSEKTYQKLKAELVEMMEGVRFNNARIEQLVEQLYELNRRLVAGEGKLLRLAESCSIKREEFLSKYQGKEVDPRWYSRVIKLAGKGWTKFGQARYKNEIHALREEIADISGRTGLPIAEFKRNRPHGAAGRARGGARQEGDGRGQSSPRHLDRQEVPPTAGCSSST